MSNIKVQHKKYNGEIIMRGNVISNQQFSSYIRPYKQTECNGFNNEQGHLMRYDLNALPNYFTNHIKSLVEELCKKGEHPIIYCIRHFIGFNPIIHGFIITDYNHNFIRSIYSRNTQKSLEIIDQSIKALST